MRPTPAFFAAEEHLASCCRAGHRAPATKTKEERAVSTSGRATKDEMRR